LEGVPLRHETDVLASKWSPDGTRIATASQDLARIWDVSIGQQIGVPLSHYDVVHDVAWSPDGTRLATAAGDNQGRVFDLLSGSLPPRTVFSALLESAAGMTSTDVGDFIPLSTEERIEKLSELDAVAAKANERNSFGRFIKWFLSDNYDRTRTISPFSLMTLGEYLEAVFTAGSSEERSAAESMLGRPPGR
jgi:WD40 repeat protein